MHWYSHQGNGPRADQTGRIHISDFYAQSLSRNAAGPYFGQTLTRRAARRTPIYARKETSLIAARMFEKVPDSEVPDVESGANRFLEVAGLLRHDDNRSK
jgi:hypothetical protein